VLLLSPLYDLLPPMRLQQVLEQFRQSGTTVLQFTGRPEGLVPDSWLWLGSQNQQRGRDLDDIRQFAKDSFVTQVSA
jgi:putative ABC transport system ATP-binding protein